MSPLVPGLMRSATSYLDAYDSSNHTGVIVAADWQDYPDDAALLAAFTFGISAGSFPSLEGHRVRKINNDPVFPNRMVRFFYPYNDDCTGCTGSAGRGPTLNLSFGGNKTNVWMRYVRRFFGTGHPQGGATSNWRTTGTYPIGSANSNKMFFMNWSGGTGRLDDEISNTTQQLPAYQITSTTATYPEISEAGLSNWYGTSVATQLTGADVWEHIFNYIRESDDLVHMRGWSRQLTSGGAWNPQAYEFFGYRGDRTGGSTFPHAANMQLQVNKNKTNQDDGLSTTTFDDPDTFAGDSSQEGTPRATGVDYKGMRIDYGPIIAIDGTINSDPFGIDAHGRSDPDW